MINRGIRKGQLYKDSDAEIDDYTEVTQLPGVSGKHLAQVLINRARTRMERGDTGDAMADYTSALEITEAPADERAEALVGRGVGRGQYGDFAGMMSDCSAALEIAEASNDQRAHALVNLAVAKADGLTLTFGKQYSEILKPTSKLPQPAELLARKGSVKAVLESVGKSPTRGNKRRDSGGFPVTCVLSPAVSGEESGRLLWDRRVWS